MFTTRDLVLIALFAAIPAALGLFPPVVIPLLGVPITAQSLGVMLAGSIIGAKRGGLALLLFIVLVLIGLPLLSGGRGGFSVFLGPSGGFLLSWPLAAFFIGYMVERYWNDMTPVHSFIFNVLGGIGVVYLVGIPWMWGVADLPFFSALFGSAWYLPGDALKAVIATTAAMTIRRYYPIIESRSPIGA